MPEALHGALLMVLGYYFAHRSSADAATLQDPSGERPRTAAHKPLWLPGGSVRAVLVVGFFTSLGIYAFRARAAGLGQLWPGSFVLDVAMFFLGRLNRFVLGRHAKQNAESRFSARVHHFNAFVAIFVGVATVVTFCVPSAPLPASVRTQFARVLPAVVSFYFGTR